MVVTGGRNPAGTSSELQQGRDGGACARRVITGWPGRLVFCGNEVGRSVSTGWRNAPATSLGNPARLAYERFDAGDAGKDRPSLDQCGLLVAVRGVSGWASLHEVGWQSCVEDGTTRWVDSEDPAKDHAYVVKDGGVDARLRKVLEALMFQARRRPYARSRPAARKALGLVPVTRWKKREKANWSAKPQRSATAAMPRSDPARARPACSARRTSSQRLSAMPHAARQAGRGVTGRQAEGARHRRDVPGSGRVGVDQAGEVGGEAARGRWRPGGRRRRQQMGHGLGDRGGSQDSASPRQPGWSAKHRFGIGRAGAGELPRHIEVLN